MLETSSNELVIRANDLMVCQKGRPVIQGLNLEVGREWVTLVGETGTLLMEVLAGWRPFAGGELTLWGKSAGSRGLGSQIAASLPPWSFPQYDSLKGWFQFRGLLEPATELCGRVELPITRSLGSLDRKERHLLGAVNALVDRRALILIDDPFSGLGRERREGLKAILAETAAAGSSILVAMPFAEGDVGGRQIVL